MISDINYRNIFLLFGFFFGTIYTPAQIKKVVTSSSFTHEYHVQKSDTSVKDGQYKLYYKKKIIENGNYIENREAGLWQYFSLDGVFEFEYDYDRSRVTKMSGKDIEDIKQGTPCLFLGSPIIPYLFIVNNIYYPQKARKHKLAGKVVLALKISKKGELWAIYLSQKLNPLLDSEVMRVARTFPDTWNWLPATRNGNPVDGEYLITIEFELE